MFRVVWGAPNAVVWPRVSTPRAGKRNLHVALLVAAAVRSACVGAGSCRPSTCFLFDLNAQLPHSLAGLRQPNLGIGLGLKARNAEASLEGRKPTAG
jgi:hypothetical protein